MPLLGRRQLVVSVASRARRTVRPDDRSTRPHPPMTTFGRWLVLLRQVGAVLGRGTVGWLAAGALASVLMAGVEVAISVFLQLFFRSIGLLSESLPSTGWLAGRTFSPAELAAALAVIGVARAGGQLAISQSAFVAMEALNARLRRIQVYDMLLHPSKHIVPASTINARVGDFFIKSALFAFAMATLLSASVQAIALIVIMLASAARETSIGLAGLAVVGVVVLAVNRRNRAVARLVPAELKTLALGIERVTRNALLVRVLRTQRLEYRRLTRSVSAYYRHSVKAAYLGNVASSLPPFAGILLILVIVGVSQRVLHTPSIALLPFLYLFVRFVQAVALAVGQFGTCSQLSPQFGESLRYVSTFEQAWLDEALRDEPTSDEPPASRPTQFADAPVIDLVDVDYSYPGGAPILRGFCLKIPANSQVAIVGPSGSGKSTVLGLVLGLFEPSRGSVAVSGRGPSEYFGDPGVRVGYVGAEPFLIAGSVGDNLLYGSAPRSDSELWDALRKARLADVVRHLPGALTYPIGEDGSGLSAGQKQRLCLARALLGRPQVLVLDEASANLDLDTEKEIAEALRELDHPCTTLIVSHREGIIAHADVVVSLTAERRGVGVGDVDEGRR